jgi:hypothetical protein
MPNYKAAVMKKEAKIEALPKEKRLLETTNGIRSPGNAQCSMLPKSCNNLYPDNGGANSESAYTRMARIGTSNGYERFSERADGEGLRQKTRSEEQGSDR